MIFNDNPYCIQSIHDMRYNLLVQGQLTEIMREYKLPVCVKLVDIIQKMLKINENKRSNITQLLKHPWLSSYYKTYKDAILSHKAQNKSN